MEPIDVTDAVREMAADTSAHAESELGASAAPCAAPKVNVGLFFDGTYNNALRSGLARTNVNRLFALYKDQRDDIRSASGTCLEEAFRRSYITGIGSETDGATRGLGGATGYGLDGVFDRLERGTNELRGHIDAVGGLDTVSMVNVDIFGFSRGAATARIFANALATANVPKLTIRFLGLFDTVGSFGMPGDDDQGYIARPRSLAGHAGAIISPSLYALLNQGELDLNIHGNTAKRVFQIGALDEFRSFFPLSSVSPGAQCTEVMCPGSHGDIGGSQFVRRQTETYTAQDRRGLMRSLGPGWFDAAQPASFWTDRRGNERVASYTRVVEPGLIFASLKAMHAQGVEGQAALHELSGRSVGEDISVPEDLTPLATTLSSGANATPDQCRLARAKYVHRSWGGVGPDMMELDGTRDKYPNQP